MKQPVNSGRSCEFSLRERSVDQVSRMVRFILRDGGAEIHCSITFEALQRLAHVSGRVEEIAQQLFDRHYHDIELMAITRYAVGDFAGGVVQLNVNDLRLPANER